MTRSVKELSHESERRRAELAATVDKLRGQISDTAEDIRYKVSPQHVKSEISDYISQKTQSWLGSLKQHATENPMQAIAAGTALAVPVLRLLRGSSLPLLMIGAGVALSSKPVRDRAAEAAAPAMNKASEMLDAAAERAQALRDDAREGLSSAQSKATGVANDAKDMAAGVADHLRSEAAQATSTISDKLRSGMDAAKDSAATAPAKAHQIIGENVALIGGFGMAIGAIIAAALPQTEAEAKVMGQTSDSMKQAAEKAARSGLQAAKDATMSAASAAEKSIAGSDLGGHASRMTQNMADKFKEAADDVVSTAFNPSQNPNT